MRADFGVVLDACVLMPMPLADTLFRMAEEPRLYIPRWSDEIMLEVSRNLVLKRGKTKEQAKKREDEIRKAFPSAWVEQGYKLLVDCMPNDKKDRHVLAAAVASRSELIVTFNKKDFPSSALTPLGVTCKSPSAFLTELYDLDPPIATRKLVEQADNLDLRLEDLLVRMKPLVSSFVQFVCGELRIELA